VTWAVQDRGYSQRRAWRLVGLHPETYRYASSGLPNEGLRATLRELASRNAGRFGYRRLLRPDSGDTAPRADDAAPISVARPHSPV